jgi:ketosteroid isomerase-like protein
MAWRHHRGERRPALALYQRDGTSYRFTGLQLLVVEDHQIANVTAYMDADLAARFQLQSSLPR